jgi:Holliday junction DNA helicase RuvB
MIEFIIILVIALTLGKTFSHKKKNEPDFYKFKLMSVVNDPAVGRLKENSFDTSKIKSYVGEEIKNFKFTPTNFKEYIGQDNAKKILSSFIEGTQKLNLPFPHTIIDGNAGFGKTTVVHLIQKELNAKIIEHISSEITAPDQLIPIFQEINNSSEKNIILFLDECHSISNGIIEIFYPILQDGKINDKIIKPFTFIGCTTEKGKLLKKYKPFVDRFKIQITLEDYTLENMIEIIKQYKEHSFPNIEISENDYMIIGRNSKYTPRLAIRLLESLIYIGEINQTLEAYSIINKELGLTKQDYIILNYLSKNNKVGVQGLCAFLDTSEANYLYQYEPYLIKLNLISRTPRGREITIKGKELLK